jgi:hypothetical protein
MAYLVGQVLSAGEDAGDHALISDPNTAFEVKGKSHLLTVDARVKLDDAASVAAFALKQRFATLGEKDDYKKDFKNEGQLTALGASANTLYGIRASIPPAPVATASTA